MVQVKLLIDKIIKAVPFIWVERIGIANFKCLPSLTDEGCVPSVAHEFALSQHIGAHNQHPSSLQLLAPITKKFSTTKEQSPTQPSPFPKKIIIIMFVISEFIPNKKKIKNPRKLRKEKSIALRICM